MSKPSPAHKKTIRVRRTENGDYISIVGSDGPCIVYTGEDARILDKLFKYERGDA